MNLLSIILLNTIFGYEQAQSFILLNTRTYWKQVGTATKNRDISIYMSKNHDNEQNIVNGNSVVEVLVHQHFPNFFSPTAAKKSWLSFVWSGEEVFLQIRKDSWLGGVLDAHLTDGRSTIEQSLSMLQPWTWGRVDEDGEEESWSR